MPRTGTVDTAKQLAKDYEQAMKGKKNIPWPPPTRYALSIPYGSLFISCSINQMFHDNDLTGAST